MPRIDSHTATPHETPDSGPPLPAPNDAAVIFFGHTSIKLQPIVAELVALLKSRRDLDNALEESIRHAARPDVASLPRYYDFLDTTVTR